MNSFVTKVVLLPILAWLGFASLPLRVAKCDEDGILARMKTLGGSVKWTDEIIDGEWRIQKHATFGYYRLIDPSERRTAIGSMKDCYYDLNVRRYRGEVPPMPGHVVVMLHGLSGSRNFMAPMGKYLEEQGGFTVVNFGYASTKANIQELTVALESVIRNLRGVHEVSFVGHSMGNILIRHLLFRFQHSPNPPPISFRRWVMISPPNQGAEIADTYGQLAIAQLFLGEAVDQFARSKGWPNLERQLATPNFEFGIIAGGRGNNQGYLPRITGDDDGLLSLQTHMLDGATDFVQVGGIHQLMPRYQSSKQATLNFLLHGHFR